MAMCLGREQILHKLLGLSVAVGGCSSTQTAARIS